MTLPKHKTIIFALFFLFSISATTEIHTRKIKTKRPVPKSFPITSKDNTEEISPYIYENDSSQNFGRIIDNVHFYGFDKTINSSSESFFISNSLDSTLKSLKIDISYLDMHGRQLHKRMVEFDCDIPPGETRRQDIKSWDIQKAFYYHQSAKPHRQATPFKVIIKLKGAILLPSAVAEKTVIDQGVQAVTSRAGEYPGNACHNTHKH